MGKSWEELVENLKRGNVRALAQVITRVENREAGWKDAMKALYPDSGKARVIGITGSPGAGKSTLTNEIAKRFVDRGNKVGIIAVDPSSPFSGGALLGDRLRMQDIFTLPEIFIRSMATRGALGGLCQSARDVTRIMDAFGKDVILIETVGVGQDEIEVVRAADIVAVVCVPGQGDGVQALKAGIMEIADIFVVNKADRDGAGRVETDIQMMLDISSQPGEKVPPVMKTAALTGGGVDELVDELARLADGEVREDQTNGDRIREEILTLIEREIFHHVRAEWGKAGILDESVSRVISRESDPYPIVEEMIPAIQEVIAASSGGGKKD